MIIYIYIYKLGGKKDLNKFITLDIYVLIKTVEFCCLGLNSSENVAVFPTLTCLIKSRNCVCFFYSSKDK